MSAGEHHHFIEIGLDKLRPTQWTAGFAEVARKRAEWARLAKKARRNLLGPRGRYHSVDDPYRSLAGLPRGAGGYAKDASPFAEVLWADCLRQHISLAQIGKSMDIAVREALGLAKSPLARYLPGWSGVTPPTGIVAPG